MSLNYPCSYFSHGLGRQTSRVISVEDKFRLHESLQQEAQRLLDEYGKDSDEYKIFKMGQREDEEKGLEFIKGKIPHLTISSRSQIRNKEACGKHHTGLIGLDYDNFASQEDLEKTLAALRQDKHVLIAGRSISGKGIHAVVPVSPTPKNAEEHELAWGAVDAYLYSVIKRHCDPVCKDASRLFAYGLDKTANLRHDVVHLPWDAEKERSLKNQRKIKEISAIQGALP